MESILVEIIIDNKVDAILAKVNVKKPIQRLGYIMGGRSFTLITPIRNTIAIDKKGILNEEEVF